MSFPRISMAVEGRINPSRNLHTSTIDEQIVSRQLLLRDTLARASSTGSTSSHGKETTISCVPFPAKRSADRLDWQTFAGPFMGSGEQHVRSVKNVFHKYINTISEMLAEGDSEAVQTAAYTIYADAASTASDADLNAKIHRLIGSSATPQQMRAIRAQLTDMQQWRTKYEVQPPISNTAVPKASAVASGFIPLSAAFCRTDTPTHATLVTIAPSGFSVLEWEQLSESKTAGGSTSLQTSARVEPYTLPSSTPSTAAAAAQEVDAIWLAAQCSQHLAMHPSEVFTLETAGVGILDLLHRNRTADADSEMRIQGALFEMLGVEGFDLMQQILSHRSQLVSISVQEYKRVAAAFEAKMSGEPSRGARPMARIGPGVTVTTADDIRAQKDQRRAERRFQRQQKNIAAISERLEELSLSRGTDTNLQALVASGFDADYVEEERRLGLRARDARRPLISVDEAIAAVSAGYGGVSKTLLPEGTVESTMDGYKQVVVPPSKLPGSALAVNLVSVESLHPLCQQAFKGITKLNRLQSELFDSAYNTSENLLVCAPTGAGKTNVAMLTICQQILQHLTPDGKLDRENLKIIYVAPMKALAQEIVAKFSQRLGPLSIAVREFTGDMQLTKKEISETQVIVTTPEKWDVITRKAGDGSLVSQVKLLIIDEVHLLADERGAVIESIVARTLRLVESSQSAIRIVGLSATLPNYQDVALFLRVNPSRGLFYFNDAYRPVPLLQTFIGVTEVHPLRRVNMMNQIAYQKAIAAIRRGKQVMVFVHSRKDTAKTAEALCELARADDTLRLLSPMSEEAVLEAPVGAVSAIQGEGRMSLNERQWSQMQKEIEKSKNRELSNLYKFGFGIHHAGMLRSDRNLSERMFAAGVTKILVCTATLAWGVNLPAHTVIIKGTQIYNAEGGGFTDLGMLDVMQIFGRAGRPQFDTSGEGIIITGHEKLQHYLQMLVQSVPIESSFIKSLPDHLNAEVVSGTVTNIREAISWLSYTYLYIRMLRNPISYGITWDEHRADPMLEKKRVQLITQAAKRLDLCHMIRFDELSGNLAVTDLGRVASHYYIYNESIETFNHIMEVMPTLSDADVLNLICAAEEFKNIKVRDEELSELDSLKRACHIPIKGDVSNTPSKVNVLMQAYISQVPVNGFTLISDTAYITQSAGRIARALFEIFLRKGWSTLAEKLLQMSITIDKRIWWDASPLWQLAGSSLNAEDVHKLVDCGAPLDELCVMEPAELGSIIRHPKNGHKVANALKQLPYVDVEAMVQPVTRTVLKVNLKLYPTFSWNDRLHFTAEPFYLWVEDDSNEHIYHHEYVLITKKVVNSGEPLVLSFSIPIFEPLPSQYWVKIVSDRWLGLTNVVPISFKHLVLPERHPPHTDLLDLLPIPVTALKNEGYQSIYKFSHFNPVQSQLFHVAFNTDNNVLLGAPTGSGKTVAAELSIFRLWNAHAGAKAVYIAPLKALVAERLKDWTAKFARFGKKVVELTGDFTPDLRALRESDVIITTPEKWDSISRGWQRRNYVQAVGLIIIDEIHLLGEDRGPVLEIIVSRMRYISSQTEQPIRFVGLSTALANARDLADWLGIEAVGLYNFRPSVRPIPMEVHIQGYPGKHYCPRMATMNKPIYAAISTYSPTKPVLVFVSSRRQTRLTALDLIAMCASDESPRRFVHMEEAELDMMVENVKDSALRHTLAFGVGIHHAGLTESDRLMVEELYGAGKIQVLICTSTLAWGVNFPAHLVVIKGTEYFDAKTSRYVDYPITDVLQMMGRAGRPQFDTRAVAVILVHEPKKNFYRKFLYEPFPVESHLLSQLVDHINAEIAGGTIRSRTDAIEYITWTYLFRRILQNPTYYGVTDASNEGLKTFLLDVVETAFSALETSGCIKRGDAAVAHIKEQYADATDIPSSAEAVAPTSLGSITSVYYLQHTTTDFFRQRLLTCAEEYPALLELLCGAPEFSELPVRHNEDELNEQLSKELPWPLTSTDFLSPHVKAYLLLQARLTHAPLPITDFISDTKTVMDQAIRVLHAMIDVAADMGLLRQVLQLCTLMQCLVMACLPSENPLNLLRGANDVAVTRLSKLAAKGSDALVPIVKTPDAAVRSTITQGGGMPSTNVDSIIQHLRRIPAMTVTAHVDAAVSAETKSRVCHVSLTADRSVPSAAVTPYYFKQKEWSWWLIVGDEASGKLLALKKVVGCTTSKHTLSLIDAPFTTATCYLVSDTMLGIDQRIAAELK